MTKQNVKVTCISGDKVQVELNGSLAESITALDIVCRPGQIPKVCIEMYGLALFEGLASVVKTAHRDDAFPPKSWSSVMRDALAQAGVSAGADDDAAFAEAAVLLIEALTNSETGDTAA